MLVTASSTTTGTLLLSLPLSFCFLVCPPLVVLLLYFFPSHPRLLTFGLCVCFAIGPLGKQSFKSWLRLNICDGIILDK
jgi:hypothetical protein